jgi:predicted Zn-dependent peptidase
MRKLHSLTALALCIACGGTTPPAPAPQQAVAPATVSAAPSSSYDQYETLPPEQREAPPPEAPTPSWSFPDIEEAKLDNQLTVQVVERHTLPLVQIKLLFLSGQATDRGKPGLAVLSGEMLKVGGSGQYASRQLLNRIESLGSSLTVITARDSTSLTLSVTSDRFEEALGLLGLVVSEPRFDSKEFTKLRRREQDRVASSAKSDPGWAGNMMMYERLFGDPKHPYAHYDATAAEVEKRALWEVKQWTKANITPENAKLLVVGDVTLDRARASAENAFHGFRGKAPPALVLPAPEPPKGLSLVLVDRPKSSQADVRLAMLGPERRSDDWAALRVANQVLGGGASGRLFQDVREKQSLAYSAYSSLDEVAEGPCPILLRAGTQTAKAGLTLQALLDHAAKLATTPPTDVETSIAANYLADVFLVNVESVGDVASLAARLDIFHLGDDYYDRYRKAVSTMDAARAQSAFAKYVAPGVGLVVVAGDAERLTGPLSHFGAVEVVNPDDGFKTVKTVPQDPNAPIELQRIDGT